MEEVIKYFESLEARLAAAEARVKALEQEREALQQDRDALRKRLAQLEAGLQEINPKLVAFGGSLNKILEIIQENQIELPEKPEVPEVPETPENPEIIENPETPEIPETPEPVVEPEPEPELELTAEPEPVQEEPVAEEPAKEEPVQEEPVQEEASPKAAIYGKAVDDIRMAISLGDRFLYQRELFGQNAELMQRTLDELNALRSFEQALEYVNTHFQWDTESTTYQQFVVTLHRRFG